MKTVKFLFLVLLFIIVILTLLWHLMHSTSKVKVSVEDKILGSFVTHVVRPELRERIQLSDSGPEIHLSVKTAKIFHSTRLSLLFFTWMQTVHSDQLYVITDQGTDDIWTKEAENSGIHVVKGNCSTGHTILSLCCKSGMEYEQYYLAVTSGKENRWFCHFDDDEYLNYGALRKELQKHNSLKKIYAGHWLSKLGRRPKTIGHFKNFPEAKRKKYYYATGASYCISAPLMEEVKRYFQDQQRFMSTCSKIGLPDDLTIGAIIGGVLGMSLTRVPTMLSQGEYFTTLKPSSLPNLITISSKVHTKNRINIPDSCFNAKDDPTGFLSYHCFLYPQTTWCCI